MVSSAANTIDAYLAELPPERRDVVSAVRDTVNARMPSGYREAMSYGMIGWAIPLERYPDTYNGQPLCYVALAAQKNAYSLYLMGVYSDSAQERALRDAAAAQGTTLDMGKCCVRFKRIDQIPLKAIGDLIASLSVEDFIALHEAGRRGVKRKQPAKPEKAHIAKGVKAAQGTASTKPTVPKKSAKRAGTVSAAKAKAELAPRTSKAARPVAKPAKKRR
jgi:Domain of unknown function (DU1801)